MDISPKEKDVQLIRYTEMRNQIADVYSLVECRTPTMCLHIYVHYDQRNPGYGKPGMAPPKVGTGGGGPMFTGSGMCVSMGGGSCRSCLYRGGAWSSKRRLSRSPRSRRWKLSDPPRPPPPKALWPPRRLIALEDGPAPISISGSSTIMPWMMSSPPVPPYSAVFSHLQSASVRTLIGNTLSPSL